MKEFEIDNNYTSYENDRIFPYQIEIKEKVKEKNKNSGCSEPKKKKNVISISFPIIKNPQNQKSISIKNIQKIFLLSKKDLNFGRNLVESNENKNANSKSKEKENHLRLITENNEFEGNPCKKPCINKFLLCLNNIRNSKKRNGRNIVYCSNNNIDCEKENSRVIHLNTKNNVSLEHKINDKEDSLINNIPTRRNKNIYKNGLISLGSAKVKRKIMNSEEKNPFECSSRMANLRIMPLDCIFNETSKQSIIQGESSDDENNIKEKNCNRSSKKPIACNEEKEQIKMLNEPVSNSMSTSLPPIIIGSKYYPPDKPVDYEEKNKFYSDLQIFYNNQNIKTIENNDYQNKSAMFRKFRNKRLLNCNRLIMKNLIIKGNTKEKIDGIYRGLRKSFDRFDDWNEEKNKDNLYDK